MRRSVPMFVSMLAALLLSAAWSASTHAQSIARIVSLAPNLTELVFAAGGGERLVGTAEYSDDPPAARRIARVGDAFRVDIERILALRPQVVLAWTSGTPPQTIAQLRSLGLTVHEFHMQRIVDIPEVLRQLGELLGTTPIASQAAERFEREIRALRERYAHREPLSVFLQVNSRPLYTVSGTQIISEVLELCGGRNVFGELEQLAPQVSLEAVIARDPQVIVISDEGNPRAKEEWRKWTHVRAVRTGNVYEVPADDLTRATTRLVQGAAELCRALDMARRRHSERAAAVREHSSTAAPVVHRGVR